MSELDYLGAAEALSNYNINLRVKGIDANKLKDKLGGSTGSFASAGLIFVNMAPKAALTAAAPFIAKAAKEYGVDADVQILDSPAKGVRSSSEFFPGLFLGIGIGGAGLAIVKLFARIFARR